MAEITPSRKKFRIAREFIQGRMKNPRGPNQIRPTLMGEKVGKIKACFVVGSVAFNLAKENSDIDIVVVHEGTDGIVDWSIEGPKKSRIHFISVSEREFERKANRPGVKALANGAVPIFGDKEYLERHNDCFQLPSLKKISAEYRWRPGFKERLSQNDPKSTRAKRFLRP